MFYMEHSDHLLKIDRISKVFGEFKALDNVSIGVKEGTVHAILGENGAGKTTLMNCLYGLYHPDGGQILLHGEPVRINSPLQAVELGIGMIHQHFMLVDTLTVTENIILGMKGLGLTMNLPKHEKRIREISEEFGFEVDPSFEIWRLPMGMRQRVEILKALYRDAKVLILDEPTSVLAPKEIDALMEALDRLKKAGKTILFITHKLEEVFTAADAITVLRHGKVTAETAVKDTNPREVAGMMVGRDVVFNFKKPDTPIGGPVLEVNDICAFNDRGLQALHDISLTVHAGEVYGIAGVDGNGQQELAEVLTGLRRPSSGQVLMSGEDITHLPVAERHLNKGMSFVPEDRQTMGLAMDFSIAKNCMLRDYSRPPYSRHTLINFKATYEAALEWQQKYDIRMRSPSQHARHLSGGNQQKLILAREIECDPKLIIVMQPCKGLDVGAIEKVQNTLLAQKAAGKAVLYISTELEHVMEISDRIGVMCAGKMVGVVRPEEATPEIMGSLMAGRCVV